MYKAIFAAQALKMLEQLYPSDFPYSPTVSVERQTLEIERLKTTLNFEQCFFVFNLIERRLENVNGFTTWFGYPDNTFNLATYFSIIHPKFLEALNINAKAAFSVANRKEQSVNFMENKVVTNLPVKHRNSNYILTKRSLYPFQIDKGGLVTAYLNHFVLLKPFEETDSSNFRTGQGENLINHEVEAAVKKQRLLTSESEQIRQTFSTTEWQIISELIADPNITQTEIAEKLHIKKETIQKTFNHRILKKAEQRFSPNEFQSIKDVASFLKAYGYI
jgi:hypothetical protein